jgi:hypothetical protein
MQNYCALGTVFAGVDPVPRSRRTLIRCPDGLAVPPLEYEKFDTIEVNSPTSCLLNMRMHRRNLFSNS